MLYVEIPLNVSNYRSTPSDMSVVYISTLYMFCLNFYIYMCPPYKSNTTFYLHLYECKKHITKSISIIIWAVTSTRK